MKVEHGYSASTRVKVVVFAALTASHAFGTMVRAEEHQAVLEEVIVTAQKREQSLQDVPISVTAISTAAIEANRVTNVTDLSGLVPNVAIRVTAGGTAIPSFTMRGITSYGVVPGSDKETSIYLDGVYIGGTRGSTFELPDIERIEVLKGPQGTLFGRNATTGAVNITTRDPRGKFGLRQDVTIGNYSQLRTRTTVDTPTWGPFSALVSFVHDKRDGDIKNLGAGTVWDRTAPQTILGVQASPKTLGAKDADTWFVAVKFQPNDRFSTTYKFDHTKNEFSPDGVAVVGLNPGATPIDPSSALINPLLGALVSSQPIPVLIDTSAKRPAAVNNSFAVDALQKNEGHNLTSEFKLADNMSLKNVAAYRTSSIASASQLDGLGGLVFTAQAVLPSAILAAFSTLPPAQAPAAIPAFAQFFATQIGKRYVAFGIAAQATGKQWSDELQFNYDNKALALTAGAIYFHQEDNSGSFPGQPNNYNFLTLPVSGRLPLGGQAVSYNKGTSLAAYTQAEFHVTPRTDLIAGARLTNDKKTGDYVFGGTYVPPAAAPTDFVNGTFTGLSTESFTYNKTKTTYSISLDFKPSDNILTYGKFSTGFVSGGSEAGLPWDPETVESWEAGVKADLLNRRLRTNLAVWHASYQHVQAAQGGRAVGHPEIGTAVADQGDVQAKGFEFEATAVPMDGVTVGASLGYTDVTFGTVNPVLIAANFGALQPTFFPKWTSSVNAQYESSPVFDEARVVLRADANWRDKESTLGNPGLAVSVPAFAPIRYSPASLILNARAALRDIRLGAFKGEIALWGRNLTDNKATLFPLTITSALAATSFQSARTYGVDFSVQLY
jgi:iron complex outermembrane receptor protein